VGREHCAPPPAGLHRQELAAVLQQTGRLQTVQRVAQRAVALVHRRVAGSLHSAKTGARTLGSLLALQVGMGWVRVESRVSTLAFEGG
jgi:hypothetical protein